MKTVDRKAVHAFFDTLIAGQPPHEQVAILKDLLVDEFCFNGIDGTAPNLTDLETRIHETMKVDQGKKIQCIKEVREATGMGLAEAKQFVESLTPGCPNYGQKPSFLGGMSITSMNQKLITDQFLASLAARLNRLAGDYGKPEPF